MSYSPSNAYYSAGPNVEIVEFTQEDSWTTLGTQRTTTRPPIMGAFFMTTGVSGVFDILTYNSTNFQYCELIYSCVRYTSTGRTIFIRQRINSAYSSGGPNGIFADISWILSDFVSGVSTLIPVDTQALAAYNNGGGNMYPTSPSTNTTIVKTHLYSSSVAKGIFYLI